MVNVGYFAPQDEPASANTPVYVLAHASCEAAEATRAAFSADPERQAAPDASQVDVPSFRRSSACSDSSGVR